jgi:hypothetical protein
MARVDEFKISPDDGFRYSAPEKDRDRHDREAGYLILGLVVLVVMLATATGRIMVFAQY